MNKAILDIMNKKYIIKIRHWLFGGKNKHKDNQKYE